MKKISMDKNDPIYKEFLVDTMLGTRQFIKELEIDRLKICPDTPLLDYALQVIDADIVKNGGEEKLNKIKK